MAASSDPTKCTHPNTSVKTVVEGGWSIPRVGGTNADGSLKTKQGEAQTIRENCPDCGWELRRGLRYNNVQFT